MRFRVQRFDPDTMKPHRIILLIGKRGTGKSVLQRDLLYHMRERIDMSVAMTPTEESAEMFREHMPDAWIYNSFSQQGIESLLALQRDSVRSKKARAIVLVLDDVMFDKRALKSTQMRDIFMNGRHLNVTLCNAMQYCMDLGPDLRSQVDYVFVLRENIISNRMKLWKYFFGMFEKYEDFSKVMDKCTENHGCMVMDNTTGSTNINECIFWYRATYDLPPFQLGSRQLLNLTQKCAKSEEDIANEAEQQLQLIRDERMYNQRRGISTVMIDD